MDNKIWDIKEAEKICCFDIDGVLMSCYPQCWIDFVNSDLGETFIDLNTMKRTVSYDDYRELKERYRLCGIKETFPADGDASCVTEELKKAGWTVIIMTARPAEKYPCIAKQTYNWLNKNNITYDYVIFGEKNKHVKVMKHFPNLKFAVEDNTFIANKMARTGCKVFVLKNKYNKSTTIVDGVIMIDKLNEIIKIIKNE